MCFRCVKTGARTSLSASVRSTFSLRVPSPYGVVRASRSGEQDGRAPTHPQQKYLWPHFGLSYYDRLAVAFETNQAERLNHRCLQLSCFALDYCLSDRNLRDGVNLRLSNRRRHRRPWPRPPVLHRHSEADQLSGPPLQSKNLRSSPITKSGPGAERFATRSRPG